MAYGDDERSPLWGLSAWASLAGGATWAASKHREGFASAWKLGSRDVALEASTAAAKNSNRFAARTVIDSSMPSMDAALNAIASSKMSGGLLAADLKGIGYKALMQGGQVTHDEAMGLLAALDTYKSPSDMYASLVSSVSKGRGATGILEREVLSLQRNIQGSAGHLAAGGIISEGIKTQSAAREMLFRELSSVHQKRMEEIKGSFSSAFKAAGIEGDVSWEQIRGVQDVIKGRNVTVPILTGKIDDMSFNIPLANVGKTYEGGNLTTRYITRKGYMSGGRKLSYSDLAEMSLTEAISSSRSRGQMRQNLHQAHQNLIQSMNDRDSASRAAAIWSMPEEVMTSGARAKARLISQEAVPFGRVSEEQTSALLGTGYHPFVSPSAAGKGVLTTRNVATDLFGDLGSLLEPYAELRPGQFIRSEWGATQEAKASAKAFSGRFGESFSRIDRKIKGDAYDRIVYGSGQNAMSKDAYSAPQLLTFYAKHGDAGYKAKGLNRYLALEQGAISSDAASMMESERIFQKKIAIDEGLTANKGLLGALRDKKYGQVVSGDLVGAGNFVGIERGTGKSISLTAGVEDVVGAELTAENEAKVYIRERQRLEKGQYWKFFSEENKYIASVGDVSKYVGMAGGASNVAGQKVEAIFASKVLSRNPMALVTQQIEALSMFAANKPSASLHNAEIEAFLADPTKFLNTKSLIKQHGYDAGIQIQKNLVGLGRKWGLENQELAGTFGLMEKDTLQSLYKEGTLDIASYRSIRKSAGVYGLGKGRLGDIVSEGGAGRMPTFEQTGFRALAMKGEEGQLFAGELFSRIEGKGSLGGLDKMAASTLESNLVNKIAKGSSAENFIDLASANLIQQEGRFVNIGRNIKAFGGSSMLYLPGTNEVGDLLSPMIHAGERIKSPIANALEGFQYQLSRGEKASEAEIESAAEGLRNIVHRTAASQVSGRGKILGARAFGGIRKASKINEDAFRVSTNMAKEMYGDLISKSTNADTKSFLQSQLADLMEGKSTMAGMWRHPTTGPESFQFVKMAVDQELADGLVAAPLSVGKIQMQDGRIKHIDLSEMVGFKGDFDNDSYNIAAISNRDVSTRVAKKYDNEISQSYTKYLFNHYNMKDMIDKRASKRAIMNASQSQTYTQAYEKLGMAKRSTGKVNVALQKFKLAVASAAPEEYRPLSELFFHLEEAAIGGKHGKSLGQSSLFQAIAEAASPNKSREEATGIMSSVIKNLMGEKETIRGQIMQGGQWTEQAFEKDPDKWASIAVDSLNAKRKDIDAAMSVARLGKGKDMIIDRDVLSKAFWARQQGSVDAAVSMGQSMFGQSDAFASKAASLMGRAQTKASGLMGALYKAKKPLLAGAAVAAGIMFMAPATSGMINKEGPAGGKNMPPDSFGPPHGQGINPPPPRQNIAPRVYDMGGGQQTVRANIRMRVGDLNRSSRNFMQSARELSGSGQVHIRTRDDRSALDPHTLANKIQERL